MLYEPTSEDESRREPRHRCFSSLGQRLELFEASAYSFLDEFRSALVAELALLQKLVDLFDELLGDAYGDEFATAWNGCPQPVTPLWVSDT